MSVVVVLVSIYGPRVKNKLLTMKCLRYKNVQF